MNDTSTILNHFAKVEPTVKSIISFARTIFEDSGRKKNKLFSTDYLVRIIKSICNTLNSPVTIRQSIHFQLYDVIAEYRILSGQQTKPADLKSPHKVRKFAKDFRH